jgi:hypothetical protein
MREAYPGIRVEKAGVRGGRRGFRGNAEIAGRAPDDGRIAHGLGRSDEQELARAGRKRAEAAAVALVGRAGHGPHQYAEPAGELGRRPAADLLQEVQRIAVGLGDDPVGHAVVERRAQHRSQQVARIGLRQAFHAQIGKPAEVRTAIAGAEDQQNGLGVQPPCGEGQRLRGSSIEPLRIVDQAYQRRGLGTLRQQAQRRQAHEEAVRRRAARHPERGAQGIPLRSRKRAEAVEQRNADLVQRRKVERGLGLGALRADQPQLAGFRRRVIEQRGLADSRLSMQNEHAAVPVPHTAHQAIQPAALDGPADWRRVFLPRARPCAVPHVVAS